MKKNWLIHQAYISGNFRECLQLIEDELREYHGLCEYPIYVKALIMRHQVRVVTFGLDPRAARDQRATPFQLSFYPFCPEPKKRHINLQTSSDRNLARLRCTPFYHSIQRRPRSSLPGLQR